MRSLFFSPVIEISLRFEIRREADALWSLSMAFLAYVFVSLHFIWISFYCEMTSTLHAVSFVWFGFFFWLKRWISHDMERNELFSSVEQRNAAHNDMRLAALLIHYYCSHFNFHNTRFQFDVDTCSSSARFISLRTIYRCVSTISNRA